jgi:predicted nucleotidyltransferase
MKTENKIIKLFIEEKSPKTIRETALKIKSDYKITHVAVQRLLGKKALLSRTIGKSVLCELNPVFYGIEIYKAEDERKEELLCNKNIKQLYKEIMSKIKTSFFVFLVFGSYAKKKQTRSSDLDLMLISSEKGFEERVMDIISLIPVKTHALVFTEEEFARMKDSKEANVVKEAIKNNVILYGIESYYRMKNA